MTDECPDTLEGRVAWARAHPSPDGKPAGYRVIVAQFGCAHSVARTVARNAKALGATAAVSRQQSAGSEQPTPGGESTSYEEGPETATLTTVSRTIRTVADALAYAEVDLETWELDRFVVNSWEMGSKREDGSGVDVTPLWQVKIWLKRRRPLSIELAVQGLIDRIEPAPAYAGAPQVGNRMVEIAIYDPHFGMLAWGAETGENYDVHIARRVVGDAAAQIRDQTADMDLDYYLLPFGQDWMHVNDPSTLTPRGQNRLDVDGRLGKITEEAERGLWDLIDMLTELAPVKLLWVPGNHDPQTSYWMLRATEQRYRLDDRVEVDTSPMIRKYHAYGANLIGFLHGCDMAVSRMKDLPIIMASEAADLWVPDQYREIHHGHRHKVSELSYVSADTHGGVVVRGIPSLVGTDFWSFQQGYIHDKTAQYFVWNKVGGMASMCNVHIDRSFYQDN